MEKCASDWKEIHELKMIQPTVEQDDKLERTKRVFILVLSADYQ